MLLGSGICFESHNGLGEQLRSADKLRQDLCSLKNVHATTALTRVAGLLTPDERKEQLVKRFSNCKPGTSLASLPNFLWKRLFTFNIDDVLETLYATSPHRKQTLIPVNFDSQFEPAPERRELQAVHLHGWVGQPESSFVFSHAEYARTMRNLNPWMHMLAEILPTEPFIIAGTSLNEFDLEFYLSNRNEATPRRSKGPSILVEPYPDAATEADCRRYGLLLVKSTFGDFLEWLHKEFPSPPTLAELIVPDASTLFQKKSVAVNLLPFFTDFKLLRAGEKPRSKVPSAFLYGHEPSQDELDEHLDILREANDNVIRDVEELLAHRNDSGKPKLVMLLNEAGTGKTTIVSRVACELVRLGHTVISVQTLSRIDVKNAIECFGMASRPIVLAVDHLADHVEQVAEILRDERTLGKVVVLAAERTYRKEYLDLVLGDQLYIKRKIHPFSQAELTQLIELFRDFGLIGTAEAVHSPSAFASKLVGDPIAIAVCRVLNDFRPLDKIVSSLLDATPVSQRLPYLCIALSTHCHSGGLRYSILQKIAGQAISLNNLFNHTVPLGLAENADDDEFVVPINAVYADRILQRAVASKQQDIFDAFLGIALGLAPYVNRKAIMMRTPEARLAGRLLDSDKIVRPMLGSRADELYEMCKKEWAWNSRYWEQRALLVAGKDLMTALQYARHAVAIERHPFTLTTLSKLLFKQIEQLNQSSENYVFAEAFDSLTDAIRVEGYRSRVAVHPFSVLLNGTARYIELGGQLSQAQRNILNGHMADAEYYFSRDPVVAQCLERLDNLL